MNEKNITIIENLIDAMLQQLKQRIGVALGKSDLVNHNECYVNIDSSMIRAGAKALGLEYGFPLVSLFANDERAFDKSFVLYYTFADRENGILYILKTAIAEETGAFDSICDLLPAASAYEREIKDLFGLLPLGHPDPKPLVFHGNWPDLAYPLRKEFDKTKKLPFETKEMVFASVEGEGIYEIPVGPVHAGIIEPGHFRFSVAGEPVINLEAQLYYVHKGIEKLCEGSSIERGLFFSERISGDESFSNSLAYCQAVEKIAMVEIPERAQLTRTFFAELERLISHLGDLGGVCLDAAYGFATFQYRMLRGWAFRIAAETCGMRFLRSINQVGGIRTDFLLGKEESILSQLAVIKKELEDTVDIVKSNSMFTDRIENTGILKNKVAKDLNAVGPGGRASGLPYDVRKDFPYCSYDEIDFSTALQKNGDICSRLHVKIFECYQSIAIMQSVLGTLKEGEIKVSVGAIPAYRCAFGMNEGPKGETFHWLMTGEQDSIFRYKVRTASFCNWPAVCQAVRGNLVPDFPLINKSFNLSYAGNDL